MANSTIPRKYINQFTKLLDNVTQDVKERLASDLEHVDLTDIALARDVIIQIMETYLGPYTNMSAQIAATFYEGVRNYQIGGTYKAVVESGRVPEATAATVQAFMQTVVDGGSKEQLIDKLVSRADYEMKRAAGDCVFINGERDPKTVRYARVVSGIDTCDFCLMLASRGFVYRSAYTAGELNHYHANCKCRVVPGFTKDNKISE